MYEWMYVCKYVFFAIQQFIILIHTLYIYIRVVHDSIKKTGSRWLPGWLSRWNYVCAGLMRRLPGHWAKVWKAVRGFQVYFMGLKPQTWWFHLQKWWFSQQKWWFNQQQWWFHQEQWWFKQQKWWFKQQQWWFHQQKWWWNHDKWREDIRWWQVWGYNRDSTMGY